MAQSGAAANALAKLKADLDLTDGDLDRLSTALGCRTDAERVAALEQVVIAGAKEQVEMFLGRRVFTRGSDMREYRLLLLIQHLYRDRLPTEEEVSALFQTTTTQSRSLLRAVTSKYQYELEKIINDALTAAVKSIQTTGTGTNQTHYLDASSEYLVQELNRRIARISPALTRLEKEASTASRYTVASGTIKVLQKAFP